MTATGDTKHDQSDKPWWRSASGIALCGFLFVGGFFLLTQHTAHVFGGLPLFMRNCAAQDRQRCGSGRRRLSR